MAEVLTSPNKTIIMYSMFGMFGEHDSKAGTEESSTSQHEPVTSSATSSATPGTKAGGEDNLDEILEEASAWRAARRAFGFDQTDVSSKSTKPADVPPVNEDLALAAKELGGLGAASSPWELNLGPLSMNSKGVSVKPQLKFGGKAWNIKAEAGVHDVREGLKLNAKAQAFVDIYSTGASVRELHDSIHSETVGLREAIQTVKYLITTTARGTGSAIAFIAEKTGMTSERLTSLLEGEQDASALEDRRPLMLRVKVSSGIGGGAEMRLGWTDTKGFRMVGAGGQVQAGLHMGAKVFAGSHYALTSIKLEIGVGNFDFYYIIPTVGKEKAERMEAEADKTRNVQQKITKAELHAKLVKFYDLNKIENHANTDSVVEKYWDDQDVLNVKLHKKYGANLGGMAEKEEKEEEEKEEEAASLRTDAIEQNKEPSK